MLFVFLSYANSPVVLTMGRQQGQGLQVAEVGVIFLSRSALGSRPVPGLSPAQLAAPGPGQQRLVTAPSLSVPGPHSSLASTQSQSDCCAAVIPVRLHRAGLPANTDYTDTRPWLTPRPPTSPSWSSSRPAGPRRR